MAIKSGKPIDRIDLTASTDATVRNPATGETDEVYQLNAHATTGTGGNVDLFLSDDATSAAGERIDRITLSGNDTDTFKPVVVNSTKYLIAQSDFAGCTLNGAFTQRTGSDA